MLEYKYKLTRLSYFRTKTCLRLEYEWTGLG